MANYLTTDTDLTAVADAIRTKGGTNAPLAFPQGFVDAIEDIEAGGGGVVIKTEITLTAELNSYHILQAMDAHLHYKNSQVFLFVFSDSAATGGADYTNNDYTLWHNGTTIKAASMDQVTGLVSPNSVYCEYYKSPAKYNCYSSAKINADGTFTIRNENATVLAPVGAICVLVEFPLLKTDGTFDLTLWGE